MPKVINEDAGSWRIFSFGMVAMTKKTYLQTPGFNTTMSGWGGEDIKFADDAIDSKVNRMVIIFPNLILL